MKLHIAFVWIVAYASIAEQYGWLGAAGLFAAQAALAYLQGFYEARREDR